MGGRGASSGLSKRGGIVFKYGEEFKSVYQSGNIKFIKVRDEKDSTRTPMETMTKGRVYAVVDKDDRIKAVVYFDKHNKRHKQIDVTGQPHRVDGKLLMPPHTHLGYIHGEKGTRDLAPKEQKMVERVLKTWYNRSGK